MENLRIDIRKMETTILSRNRNVSLRKVISVKCPKCGGTAIAKLKYPHDLYNCIKNIKAQILNYITYKIGRSKMDALLHKAKVSPWASYKRIQAKSRKVERTAIFRCGDCGHKFKGIVRMNSRATLRSKIKKLTKLFELSLSKLPSKDRTCYFCGEPLRGTKLCDRDGRNTVTTHHVDGNHNNNRPNNLALVHSSCHKSFNLKVRRKIEVPLLTVKKKLGHTKIELIKSKLLHKGNDHIVVLRVKCRKEIKPANVKFTIEHVKRHTYDIKIPFREIRGLNDSILKEVVKQIFESKYLK